MYDEEDFQPGLYNFSLCNDLSDQKVVAMLKDAENELNKKLKEQTTGESQINEDLNATLNRLKFLRLLLQSLLQLYPTKSLSPNEMEMAEITKLLTGALQIMPAIKTTISLGTQPDPESMKTIIIVS